MSQLSHLATTTIFSFMVMTLALPHLAAIEELPAAKEIPAQVINLDQCIAQYTAAAGESDDAYSLMVKHARLAGLLLMHQTKMAANI